LRVAQATARHSIRMLTRSIKWLTMFFMTGAAADHTDLDRRVQAVRRFNRFYTRQIGVLHDALYRSPFSLTEVRVLYELAHREAPAAAAIGKELGIDAGYLSRILREFGERGLLRRRRSESDDRQSLLSLTAKGRKVFEPLNERSNIEVRAMLGGLSEEKQHRIVEAMETIEGLLGPRQENKVPYLLRPHQPGDMGWVVYRHGVLYAQEYGVNELFEALIAEIVAKFIPEFDARRERCWIAERDGEIVGSVFLVRDSDEVAKLRLLLVEPEARGLGIGNRLVSECVRFAQQVRYRKITLWTNSVLVAARNIYEKAGFRMIRSQPDDMFRAGWVGENWELEL
jgi:DNA-binding MarR family transcriptional regulator/N-acetylglutamate synthase-like GNAT family acetyltransferase